jgi:hypothetical protein
VETETADPKTAYERFAPSKPIPCPDEFPGE